MKLRANNHYKKRPWAVHLTLHNAHETIGVKLPWAPTKHGSTRATLRFMTRNTRIRSDFSGGQRRAWPITRGALAVIASVSLLFATAAPAGASPVSATRSGDLSSQGKITADWVAFFSGATSATRKIALLQNGKTFAKVIEDQASSPLSKSVAAKVSKVTLTSSTQANVRYSLTLGGQPALSNVQGQAVLISGTWKVGDRSFCGLLALEQDKVPACSAAGA
jgi:hypothetical protein